MENQVNMTRDGPDSEGFYSVTQCWAGVDAMLLSRFAHRTEVYFKNFKPSPRTMPVAQWQLFAKVLSQASTKEEANAAWQLMAEDGVEYQLGNEAERGVFEVLKGEATYYIQFKRFMKEDKKYGI